MFKIFFDLNYEYLVFDKLDLNNLNNVFFYIDKDFQKCKISFKINIPTSDYRNFLVIGNKPIGFNGLEIKSFHIIAYIDKQSNKIKNSFYDINGKMKDLIKEVNFWEDDKIFFKFFEINNNKFPLEIYNLVVIYDEEKYQTFSDLNYYPKTLLLIDFFDNHPKNKFLFNRIKNLFETNYVGYNEVKKEFKIINTVFDLPSGFDNNNIYDWRIFGNLGNFKINGILCKTINEKPMKYLLFIFKGILKLNKSTTIDLINFENNIKLNINRDTIGDKFYFSLIYYDNNKEIVKDLIVLTFKDEAKDKIFFKFLIIKIFNEDWNKNYRISFKFKIVDWSNHFKEKDIKNIKYDLNFFKLEQNINFSNIIIGKKYYFEEEDVNIKFSYFRIFEFQIVEGFKEISLTKEIEENEKIENFITNNQSTSKSASTSTNSNKDEIRKTWWENIYRNPKEISYFEEFESLDYNNKIVKNIKKDIIKFDKNRDKDCFKDLKGNCSNEMNNLTINNCINFNSNNFNFDYNFNIDKIYIIKIIFSIANISYGQYIKLSFANQNIILLWNNKKNYYTTVISRYSTNSLKFILDRNISFEICFEIEELKINKLNKYNFNIDCKYFDGLNYVSKKNKNDLETECINLKKIDEAKFYYPIENSYNYCQNNCKKCKYFHKIYCYEPVNKISKLFEFDYIDYTGLKNYFESENIDLSDDITNVKGFNYDINLENNCSNTCNLCLDKNKFCIECKENMILNSNNQDCINSTGYRNDNKDICLEEYFYNSEGCAKCSENCSLCLNNYECLRCKNNFYEYVEASKTCEKLKGCKDYECKECLEGYFLLKPGKCVECVNNCEICIKNKICLKCNSLFVNNFENCFKNNNNCNESNGLNCLECKNDNFILRNLCIKDKTINIYNNELKKIKKCEQNYIFLNNQCINNNEYILNNKCNNKFFQINVFSNFICIKNDIRIKSLKPTEYNYHYFYDNFTKKIKLKNNNIIDNCSYNLNNNKCEICEKGYFNNRNVCRKIIISKCLIFLDYNLCLNCRENYFLDFDNNCKKINKDCEIKNDNNNKCIKCNDGYFLDNIKNLCEKCNPIYCIDCFYDKCLKCKQIKDVYLDKKDFKCKKCRYPCKRLLNNNIIECYKNYYLKKNLNICYKCNIDFCKNCYENKCLECQDGFYLKNFICLKCQKNCLLCKDKNICLKASNSKYILDNKVKNCRDDCSKCLDYEKCIKCKNNNDHYLDLKNYLCVKNNYCKIKNKKYCDKCLDNYYFENESNKCKKCDISCKNCEIYKNNCTECKNNYFLWKIKKNNVIGKCFLKCPKNEIFLFSINKCVLCSFINWDILNKYYLRLKIPKEIIIEFKKEYIIKYINIIYKNNNIKFFIDKIEKTYILLKLDLKYDNSIIYLSLKVDSKIFKNSKTICNFSDYYKKIRAINRDFIKITKSNKIFNSFDKNSEEYKNIQTYGDLFDKISYFTSITLLITIVLTPNLGNILSKMFNTFQLIAYISLLKIEFSEIANTIFEIVNWNLSIIFDYSKEFNINKKTQSFYSYNSYKYNKKLTIIDQRFFTNIEMNSILIFISFIIIFLINIIQKIIHYLNDHEKYIYKNELELNEFSKKVKALKFIKIEKANLKIKLKLTEKIKFFLKNFILTMIFSESPNIFLFIFNYYKSFSLLDFNFKTYFIVITYWIYYHILIYYFIYNSINLTIKLKKYSIFLIYNEKWNYYCDYLFIIGNFKKYSFHNIFWIFEFCRNFLMAFNLLYFNNIFIQITTLLLLQFIYIIIINFYYKLKNNLDYKFFKLTENLIFLLLLLLLNLALNNELEIKKKELNNLIIGLIISILFINILKSILELIKLFYKFIKSIISNFVNKIR